MKYETTSWRDAPVIAREHGFCLLRGFFKEADVRQWEALALQLTPADRRKDFLSLSTFDSLIFDDRVLELAKLLLGPELVYYGETSCSLDVPPFRNWHCDALGTPAKIDAYNEPDVGEVYPAWRFAVYFRDYRVSSGGLKVSPGSHLRPRADMQRPISDKIESYMIDNIGALKVPVPRFPLFNVPSAPGDLVIFNLCSFHSAGALLLKQHPQAQLLPKYEAGLLENQPDIFEPFPEEPRNALFFDYGAPAVSLDLYIKWRCHSLRTDRSSRNEMEKVIQETDMGDYFYDQPRQRQLASDHGITLRFDRIIAQLLNKAYGKGLSGDDRRRLQLLLKMNKEFSRHHSLVPEASRFIDP